MIVRLVESLGEAIITMGITDIDHEEQLDGCEEKAARLLATVLMRIPNYTPSFLKVLEHCNTAHIPPATIRYMDWLGWICAAGALIGWLWERHERHADKKELDLIRRRSSGPYLRPSDARFHHIYYYGDSQNEIKFRPMGSGASLDVARTEVAKDLPAGHEVFLVLDVSGEPCPEVTSEIDGEPVAIRQEADINDAAGRYFLVYKYRPEKHGQKQTLTLRFLSASGIRDVHRYETVHGHRVLKRIEPT